MSVEPFVYQNIDTFLDLFQRVRKQSQARALRFHTWVENETGQLCFAEEGREPLSLQSKQWQRLELTCVYDVKSDQIHLEDRLSILEGLSPLARRIVQESKEALKQLEGATPASEQVADHVLLSKIWYPVDRKAAEKLLRNKPIGTYLCRKDEFASLLEDSLSLEMGKKVLLWTFTVLSSARRCSDYTLVHMEESWQIYDDDLSLGQKTFSGLAALLRAHKRVYRYPLCKKEDAV